MAYHYKLGEILQRMGYTPKVDFIVTDLLDGGSPEHNPQITEWNAGSPIPTEQDIQDEWDAWQVEIAATEAYQQSVPYLQIVAKNKIDQIAENARLKYITFGSGQALVYEEKAEEAADYVAAGYPAIGSPVDYPFIAADAEAYGITPQEAADQILTKKAEWTAIGALIEKIRLTGKKAVDDANNEDEINTARDNAIAQLEAL